MPPAVDESLPDGMTTHDIDKAFDAEGFGDEEPKTETDMFIRECLDWLAQWFAANGQLAIDKGVKPFMFVFDHNLPTRDLLPDAKPLPAFRTALEAQIGGHIYASSSNLREVLGVETSKHTCSHLLGYLSEVGLQSATAITVSPEGQFALVHRGGDPNDADRIPFARFANKPFTFDSLDGHLEEFYDAFVSTHEGYCHVWAKANDRELKEKPEAQIQKALQGFLQYGVLPKYAKVFREIQTRAGREDIQIIRARPDRTIESAVLELKVLFPQQSEKWNLNWAKEGVDQAAAYAAADETTTYRGVCCYDGRMADEAMPDGVTYANSKKIIWRRYFMTTPKCDRKTIGYDC